MLYALPHPNHHLHSPPRRLPHLRLQRRFLHQPVTHTSGLPPRPHPRLLPGVRLLPELRCGGAPPRAGGVFGADSAGGGASSSSLPAAAAAAAAAGRVWDYLVCLDCGEGSVAWSGLVCWLWM